MIKKCKVCNIEKNKKEFKRGNICTQCEKKRNKIIEINYYNKLKNEIIGNLVYRLINNNKIIYIGKSTQLYIRLKQHCKDKTFDKVEVIQFNNEVDMCIAEIYFINKYKPILNKEFMYSNSKSMSLYELDDKIWYDIQEYSNKSKNHIEEIIEKRLDINFGLIRTCFIRKRSENFLVYVENKEGRQKRLRTFKDNNSAEKFLEEIKQHINR